MLASHRINIKSRASIQWWIHNTIEFRAGKLSCTLTVNIMEYKDTVVMSSGISQLGLGDILNITLLTSIDSLHYMSFSWSVYPKRLTIRFIHIFQKEDPFFWGYKLQHANLPLNIKPSVENKKWRKSKEGLSYTEPAIIEDTARGRLVEAASLPLRVVGASIIYGENGLCTLSLCFIGALTSTFLIPLVEHKWP